MGVKTERVSAFRPLGDIVVVSRENRRVGTDSGIVIPDVAQRDGRLGRVVSSGPGVFSDTGVFVKNELKGGELVMTERHRVRDIEHDGDALDVMPESKCLLVVDGNRIVPLGSRVVVRRLDRGDMSESGLIHVPDAAQENRRLAEVVAVGRGRVTDDGSIIPPRIGAGAVVLTVKYRGVDIEFNGVALQVMDESDCMMEVVPAEGPA